jgi:phospholipase C
LPRQETGLRVSAPLPYELLVDGALGPNRDHFRITFSARKQAFGERAAGSPFRVQAIGYTGAVQVRDYAVEAGRSLSDTWALADFKEGRYQLRVYGPNGFYREFSGTRQDPAVEVHVEFVALPGAGSQLSGALRVVADNKTKDQTAAVEVRDYAYGHALQSGGVEGGQRVTFTVETAGSSGWYDLGVRVAATNEFEYRYAGRVETEKWSISDPVMGGVRG